MNSLGPCSDCGEALGADQRYCANCGHRVEAPLAPTYRPVAPSEAMAARSGGWPFPVPISMASTFAALALAFGVVMGTAVSPNLSNLVAGGHLSSDLQAQVHPESEAPPATTTSKPKNGGGKNDFGGSGFDSGSTFNTSSASGSGFYGTSGSGTDNGSGGVDSNTGKKKKKKKKKPVKKPTYLTGTVVHDNPFAVSYSISSGGGLSAIHVSDPSTLPVPGTKVKVPIRQLANGTFAEDGARVAQGLTNLAQFSGVVTDSRAGIGGTDPSVYTVSARGVSLMVYVPSTSPLPTVGQLVTTTVEIKNVPAAPIPPGNVLGTCGPPPTPFPTSALPVTQQLWQSNVTVTPTVPLVTTQIETLVQNSCTAPPPGSVVVSSDDVREGLSNTELIASGVDPATLIQGNVIIASVTIAGGALTNVTGVVSDQGINGASTRASAQGKLARAARR